MPTAATTVGGTSQSTQRASSGSPAPVVPFIRASGLHREPTGIDVTRSITTSDQDFGVFDVPAYGYVRSLIVLVEATGGAGTAITAAEDGPWSVIKSVALTEPNGAIINQFTNGYGLYLANKYGGYRSPLGADPKASPVYSAVGATSGNFRFLLRIPVELNLRDGLGSLPNQNAAATFKLRLGLAKAADVYGTLPATLPSIRVRVYLEAWDQPESQSAGQTNQITPPAMNTTQFWTEQVYNVNAGAQNIRLTRVGNYIRNLVCVYRRNGSSRANGQSDFPDPMTLNLDTRPVDIVEKNNFTHQMYERSGYGGAGIANDAARGLDNGVFVIDFTSEFDGTYGLENRDLWLPTLGSTRLEVSGTFANPGTLTVMTNDVAIAGSVFI